MTPSGCCKAPASTPRRARSATLRRACKTPSYVRVCTGGRRTWRCSRSIRKNACWVIKHGIKMSAMRAWDTSHDDMTIWSMVAFLQKLPQLPPAEYEAIVAQAPPDDDMNMHAELPVGSTGHVQAAATAKKY